MAGATRRVLVGRRILMNFIDGVELSGETGSLNDIEFGFFEEGDGSPESCGSSDHIFDDEGEEQTEQSCAEKKAFWEKQHELLHATLIRSSSLESKIRQATRGALRESQLTGPICICQKSVAGESCRSCLRRDVSDRLRNAGYNSAICKSKWRTSPDIPKGEHSYIDVLDKSSSKKGETRVVIELNFRAEFEMARASEEYNRLVNGLPEVFVGKAERLRTVIKIICSAAKKCMKENKMHMGPWRKHKYMQAKWFDTCERSIPTLPCTDGHSSRLQRPRSSMLTFDLLDNLPSLHCTAVKVL